MQGQERMLAAVLHETVQELQRRIEERAQQIADPVDPLTGLPRPAGR